MKHLVVLAVVIYQPQGFPYAIPLAGPMRGYLVRWPSRASPDTEEPANDADPEHQDAHEEESDYAD